jgi:hypothetical protein
LGNLVCGMQFQNEKWPDFSLVFQRFKETKEFCLTVDKDNETPFRDDTIKSLATSISFDQDFIVLGDAYRNVNILKKGNPDDNRKQNLDSEKIHIIKYTKNNLQANVKAAFSMSRHLSYDRTDFMRKLDAEA